MQAAKQLIEWYRARWEIELFFHVVKNGCRIEALQLSSIERLERAIALYLVVAWRIARLMRLGRKCDREPGGKTPWIGMQRVADFAAGLGYAREIQAL